MHSQSSKSSSKKFPRKFQLTFSQEFKHGPDNFLQHVNVPDEEKEKNLI
jgi:hypothetical protein